MQPLKKAIIKEIKENFPEFCNDTDENLGNVIFHHPDGMRLSSAGYKIIRKLFTPYSFELPSTIKSRHHLNMGNMQYPFYLSTRKLILFSEVDAMVVKLSGGIELFLESCS